MTGGCHQVTSTSPDQTASLRYSLQQTFSPHSKVPPWIENIFSSKSKNQNDVEQAGGRWVIRPSEGKQQPAQPLIRCLGIHHKFCVHSRNLVAAHLASCHPTTVSIYFYLGQIFLSTITKIFIYLPHHMLGWCYARYILCSNHKCLHSFSEYLRKYLGSWSAWWREEVGSHLALGVMKICLTIFIWIFVYLLWIIVSEGI